MPIKIVTVRTDKPSQMGRPRELSPETELQIVRRLKLGGEKRAALRKEFDISNATMTNILKRTRLVTLHLGPKPQEPQTDKAA